MSKDNRILTRAMNSRASDDGDGRMLAWVPSIHQEKNQATTITT
jgi:hypothetical protein